jgi:tetratricopeptide (TPR) repeat protein
VTHLLLVAVLGAAAPPGFSPGQPAPAAPRQAVAVAPGSAAPAQLQVAGAPAGADDVAGAYLEFVLARRLEDRGEVEAAIAALQRAMKLDPKSADLRAELAGLYARQSRLRESIEAANAALAINPGHGEANRVLGSIYASFAERDPNGAAPGAGQPGYRQLALEHLERSLKASSPATAIAVRLTIARLQMSASAFDKAIPVLRQLLADEPWLPQGVAMLAQAYTESGQSGSAIALLQEAVAIEPAFHETLASAYEKDRRWPEAARAYEQASDQSPRDMSLKTRWAFSLLSIPDGSGAKRARDILLEVTKASPTEGWPLYLLARAERAAGDLAASESAARRLMAISPGSTSGAHALAQVLEARREWPALIEALEPIAANPSRAREGDTALILTHLGFAYLEVGRDADAVAAFERASTLDASDSASRVYLAQALVSAKQYDRALAVVRAERQADPKDSRLARLEADAIRGLGRFDDGAAVLKGLVAASPGDASAVQNLAEYYAAANRYAEAAGFLKDAVARFPDSAGVLFQYGAMLERQSLHADAERVFRRVLERSPEHGPTLNYLGYTLVERGGSLEEAVVLLKRAVALDPYNGAYLDSLGWAYLKLDQLDLAEPNLRIAAGQLPRDSVVQDHWGDLLAKRGKYADAVEAWRRALAGDGDEIERPKIERKISDALNKLDKR